MQYVKLVLLTLISHAICKPYQHRHQRRHDLDHNGIPDKCFLQGSTTKCLLSDGTWSVVPATVTGSTTLPITTIVVTPSPWVSAGSMSSSEAPQKPMATLPPPSQFQQDKGSKWKIELQGNLGYDGPVATKNVVGDKARTGKIGNKIIWNFGDMMCEQGLEVCGFGYGPAWYGTDELMLVNTSDTRLMQNHDLILPWIGDAAPEAPQTHWGMDTSNIVELNDTHGVAYSWQIWRGAPGGSYVDRGNAVSLVTLGDQGPKSERQGPLLTGPEEIQLGLIATLRDGDYVYTYSTGGPSGVIVGRARADESVFDSTKHEFLLHDNSSSWQTGIPRNDTVKMGAVTENPGGKFACAVYGSVFFNTYLQKYVMMCSIWMTEVNMYVSDTPYGPFSARYAITSSGNDGLLPGSYGAMAHPEYGAGQQFHFSIGPNSVFQMFKLTFDY